MAHPKWLYCNIYHFWAVSTTDS